MSKYLVYILLFAVALPADIFAKDVRAEKYLQRYKAKCLSEKIVDNFGNGYDSLYGLRNMRTILYGVAYRGGANNFFHKTAKRDNKNPLPPDGLKHLANEGFSLGVYLYANNFKTADAITVSDSGRDTLRYIQNSGASKEKLRKLLEEVKAIIDDPNRGPAYLHCWNGWHQSGYVSACILRQFCGFSGEEAVEYWIKNTDGANKGYEHIKKKIMEFEPYEDLKPTKERQKEICPSCQ